MLDDNRLSDGAKLLYGKIARISFVDGYCWASNAFLDGTKSGRNASRFISELRGAGYIVMEKERSKFRKIRISAVESRVNPANSGEVENPERAHSANSGEVENPERAHSANFGEVENPERAHSANFGGVENPENGGNTANFGEVEGPKSSYAANFGEVESPKSPYIANSGDRTVVVDIYNKTTTIAPGPRESGAERPPSAEELKQALTALEKTLILRENFYPRAAAFMSEKGLDKNYPAWIYSQCEVRKPVSFDGYYFTLFFEENMAEKYLAGRLPEEMPEPPPHTACPACGASHDPDCRACPACGLPRGSPPEKILLYRELRGFPPEKRKEYFRREDAVYAEGGIDFPKIKSMIADLKKEFALTAAP